MRKLSFGFKWGLFFGFLGIPFSLFLNIVIAVQLEMLAEKLSYNMWDFSLYVSLVFLILPFIFYVLTLFFNKKKRNTALIILFVFSLAFLNISLFYCFVPRRIDGQLAFAILAYPFKTAILYPLFGYFHDWRVSVENDRETIE